MGNTVGQGRGLWGSGAMWRAVRMRALQSPAARHLGTSACQAAWQQLDCVTSSNVHGTDSSRSSGSGVPKKQAGCQHC